MVGGVAPAPSSTGEVKIPATTRFRRPEEDPRTTARLQQPFVTSHASTCSRLSFRIPSPSPRTPSTLSSAME